VKGRGFIAHLFVYTTLILAVARKATFYMMINISLWIANLLAISYKAPYPNCTANICIVTVP
jgi:hypothetical protein